MTPSRFDLQSHSLYSDGALPPAQVIEHAAAAGVGLTALTDHDTLEGVDEALAAGARHGIEVVPATEITVVDEAGKDLHVLAYCVDHRDDDLLDLHGHEPKLGPISDTPWRDGVASLAFSARPTAVPVPPPCDD